MTVSSTTPGLLPTTMGPGSVYGPRVSGIPRIGATYCRIDRGREGSTSSHHCVSFRSAKLGTFAVAKYLSTMSVKPDTPKAPKVFAPGEKPWAGSVFGRPIGSSTGLTQGYSRRRAGKDWEARMSSSGILGKTAVGLGAVAVPVVFAVAGAGQASADPGGICVSRAHRPCPLPRSWLTSTSTTASSTSCNHLDDSGGVCGDGSDRVRRDRPRERTSPTWPLIRLLHMSRIRRIVLSPVG
jgi:hypothetical protein